MGRTACTDPQCLYKGSLYLYLYKYNIFIRPSVPFSLNFTVILHTMLVLVHHTVLFPFNGAVNHVSYSALTESCPIHVYVV